MSPVLSSVAGSGHWVAEYHLYILYICPAQYILTISTCWPLRCGEYVVLQASDLVCALFVQILSAVVRTARVALVGHCLSDDLHS